MPRRRRRREHNFMPQPSVTAVKQRRGQAMIAGASDTVIAVETSRCHKPNPFC